MDSEAISNACTYTAELVSWSDQFHGFPFQTIRINGNEMKICVLSAPPTSDKRHIFHDLKKQGYLMVGISSHGHFPFLNQNDCLNNAFLYELTTSGMKNILNQMDCWLTCSKIPVPYNIPQFEFSESDCPNMETIAPKGLEKRYDVIYNAGSDGPHHYYHKNWPLAVKCIKKMKKAGLKILVVGRTSSRGAIKDKYKRIEYKPFTTWNEFIDLIEVSRVMFISSVSDASPRILTESLCKGTPILVNKDIFGGWKYVNENTGAFFSSKKDVMPALNNIFMKAYDTRQWFLDNYYRNNVSIKQMELGIFLEGVIREKEKGLSVSDLIIN